MTVKFGSITKHGREQFLPDVALAFEGERVEEFFITAGWAAETNDDPVRTYTADEVTVDPATTFGTVGHEAQGQPVLAPIEEA